MTETFDYAADTGPVSWKISPYLHVEPDRVYDPLTDRSLVPGQRGFAELQELYQGAPSIDGPPDSIEEYLRQEGWLVDNAPEGLQGSQGSRRFFLKYVSLEANTTCNQSCYFCPVSVNPREPHFMPMDFYEEIVQQLASYRETIEGVSMIHYNEATIDKRFLDRICLLRSYDLPPVVATNGTGMTPEKVDAIMQLGGLRYLCINHRWRLWSLALAIAITGAPLMRFLPDLQTAVSMSSITNLWTVQAICRSV
jgi:hypothetical protein